MRRLVPLLLLAACSEPILVSFDEPPIVSIQQPVEGAEADEGAPLTFVGRIADDGPVEQVVVSWLDNGTTVLQDGVSPDDEGYVSLTTAALGLGSHAVTLRAVDPTNLSGEDVVTVLVVEVVDTPSVTVVHPTSGDRAEQDQDFLFEATVSDPQDDPPALLLEAESDRDGFLCSFDIDAEGQATCLGRLATAGTHRVTFTVTDTDGNTARRTASLTVDPVAQVPQVTISSPTSGAVVRTGRAVQLTATVVDRQTPAFELLVVVSSDLDGELCRPPVDGAGLTSCARTLTTLGTHLLTFSATDGDANTGTQSVLVTHSDGSDIDDDGDGFSEDQGDCDDEDRLTHPGATETPDGEDDDCDLYVDEGTILYDDDGDGFCEAVSGACSDGASLGDCDDGDRSASPGGVEVCGDAVDNDCQGGVDEDGAQGCTAWWRDADADRYGDATQGGCSCTPPGGAAYNGQDCDDAQASINPGAPEAIDGIDNDCDGRRDEGTDRYDNDGDGYCKAASCTTQADGSTALGNDCDDADSTVNPAAAEVCNDGTDNDCDRQQDEGLDGPGCIVFYRDKDGDGFGAGAGACSCMGVGLYTAQIAGDCYDENAQAFPGQSGWFDAHRGDGSFDFDCANGEQMRWDDEYTCECTIYLGPIPFVVDPFEPGWDDTPDCGEGGLWYTDCEYPIADADALGLCIPLAPATASTTGRVQQCR